jgi:hypothetical protein
MVHHVLIKLTVVLIFHQLIHAHHKSIVIGTRVENVLNSPVVLIMMLIIVIIMDVLQEVDLVLHSNVEIIHQKMIVMVQIQKQHIVLILMMENVIQLVTLLLVQT